MCVLCRKVLFVILNTSSAVLPPGSVYSAAAEKRSDPDFDSLFFFSSWKNFQPSFFIFSFSFHTNNQSDSLFPSLLFIFCLVCLLFLWLYSRLSTLSSITPFLIFVSWEHSRQPDGRPQGATSHSTRLNEPSSLDYIHTPPTIR